MSDTNKETINHEEEVITPTEERTEELKTQDPEWYTKEVAKIRKNKQEEIDFLKQKLSELESKKETPTIVEDEIVQKIKSVLDEERKVHTEKEREENLATALENYKNSNKLFHEDNDPEGTKFSVVKEQLKEFNLAGASSVKDFESYLDKASRLAGIDTEEVKEESLKTPSTTPMPGSRTPIGESQDSVQLSKEDVANADRLGMKHDRYLELKKRYPDRF